MGSNIKIELHLIQNFAPSCLNRDDANAPKDCEFGGVRRARISSQCIKKSQRDYFRDSGSVDTGVRTKLLKSRLLELLSQKGSDEDAGKAVDAFLSTYYSGMDKKKTEQTSVLLYVSSEEISADVECISANWEALVSGKHKEDKAVTQRLKQARLSADIALFGRMLAEKKELSADASVQVAHAISTHRVDMDFDFYTAVDDMNPESETGAGMMGETGFNSACFYRYAVLDRNQLVTNLGGDEALADKVISAFLEASVLAIPTGKQNAFAAQNKPAFGLFVVRKNGSPCSLANAFAKPVTVMSGRDEDLVGLSVRALCGHLADCKKVYGCDDVVSESLFQMACEERLGDLAQADRGSLKSAIDAAINGIAAAREG